MGKKAAKMYDKDKSPALGRDEKGNVEVKPGKLDKGVKPADDAQAGTEGTLATEHEDRHGHDRREMHHRHMKEKLDMHHKHEMEHGHHEGAKEEMHDRHEKEMKEMHTRHEHEHKAMHTKHEKEGGATEGGKEETHGAKGGVEKPKEEHKAKPGEAGEKGKKE